METNEEVERMMAYLKSEDKVSKRHVVINLDLEDIDMSPSEMEQLITRALSGSTMFDKDIKNVEVTVSKT